MCSTAVAIPIVLVHQALANFHGVYAASISVGRDIPESETNLQKHKQFGVKALAAQLDSMFIIPQVRTISKSYQGSVVLDPKRARKRGARAVR